MGAATLEIDSHKHSAGKVGANADKAVRLHEEIEEEALMEMLQQVIQTAKNALYASAHGHFILPALSHSLEGDSVNVVGDKTTVRSRGVTQALANHSS